MTASGARPPHPVLPCAPNTPQWGVLKRLNSPQAFLLVVNLSAACSDAETYVYSYPHVHIFFGGVNTNDIVEVHYSGALDYGEEFDSTSSLPYRWRRLLSPNPPKEGVRLAS